MALYSDLVTGVGPEPSFIPVTHIVPDNVKVRTVWEGRKASTQSTLNVPDASSSEGWRSPG